MKKFILFVALLALTGLAGAVQNFGPPSGIKVAAIDVTNDARIRGDLTVDSILGVGTNVSNGVFSEDIALGAGYDWYSIAGAGVVDFGNMTGYFKGPTGITLWNGNTKITGTKTFMVNGGASKFGAAVSVASLTDNSTAIIAGTSYQNATRVTSLVASGTSYQNATRATTIIASGATYLNATTLGGAMAYSVNASTTVSTVRTSTGTKTVFGVDAHSANVTLTLPDAATVPGRVYQIGTNVDPGSYYVKITATTADKLGGSGGFTIAQTTDAKAGMALVSDGTLYLIYGAYGTWAEGTA